MRLPCKKDGNLTNEEIIAYVDVYDSHFVDILLDDRGYSYWEIYVAEEFKLIKEMFSREISFYDNFDIYDTISEIPENIYGDRSELKNFQNKIDNKYYFLKSNKVFPPPKYRDWIFLPPS